MASFISAQELAQLVRDPTKTAGTDYLVVDVRDSDFAVGHIPGALNVPAHDMYAKAGSIIDTYSHVPLVVFHCMLSQQRGPKAARIYKETVDGRLKVSAPNDPLFAQSVRVLDRGFGGWSRMANDRQAAHRRLSERRHADETFNIMVAGPRGVGKSTLLQTLCDSFSVLHIDALSEDPATKHVVRVELIDTPGIDRDEVAASACVNELCGEIERRFRNTVDEEMSVRRSSVERTQHVHAVVYVVAPPVSSSHMTDAHAHRLDASIDILTETDVRALRRLAQLTNVIVVVGKSDTLEASDRALLKNRSFYKTAQHVVSPHQLFAFTDLPDTLQEPACEVDAMGRRICRRMPFLVCGSKHVDQWQQTRLPEFRASASHVTISDWRALVTRHNQIAPTHVPQRPEPPRPSIVSVERGGQRREISLVREFPWGVLHLNNPTHCDFALLVDVLLSSFRKSMVCWVDEHYYEAYRMRRVAADPLYGDKARDRSEYLEAKRTSAYVANAVCDPPANPRRYSVGPGY
ncbi:Cdc25 phosphatase Ibp1 [Coemansia sp. RSA 521]|nr:Cdc25 phosphatase Ibp1 [Coemansia sp. RSA 521]